MASSGELEGKLQAVVNLKSEWQAVVYLEGKLQLVVNFTCK